MLLKGLDIGVLLVDKDYDTNEILEYAREHGITAVIPPKKTAKFKENMIKNCIISVILLKMLSCILNLGGALPLVMRKMQILSLPLSIFVALLLLFPSCDDIIWCITGVGRPRFSF